MTTDVVAAPTLLAFTDSEPWIDTQDRQAVVELAEQTFVESSTEMAWTGSHETCDAGESSEDLRAETLSRVNFYRAMAGVPALVTDEPVYSAKAQHGALTMSAEGALSHTPTDDYECISEFGFEAAANSNLYLGRSGAHAIDGYIEDPGDGNVDVGHRLTVLHPPTSKMGVGHVAATETNLESNVLWVFDDDVFEEWSEIREHEAFVAWPPRGFVPSRTVFPRWSFSLLEADFSQAEVTMTADGLTVPLEVVARNSQASQVPPPVVVWEPELNLATGDNSFEISISNVLGPDGPTTYSYEVTVIN